MNDTLLIRFLVSLVPVVLFLLTLVTLDSYKLVALRSLAMAIVVGAGSALVCLSINNAVLREYALDRTMVSRYLAPPLEEVLKAVWVAWLIARRRVGFTVDAAIVGFAVGTGFALIENMYYVQTLKTNNVMVWLVRGLGTAIMHGGMTAVFGIVTKTLADRFENPGPRSVAGRTRWLVYLPGVLLATALHSFYNHFILPPVTATLVLHVALPAILVLTFWQSERATRQWLGAQMDVDAELLEILTSGGISESRIGRTVETLRGQFAPEVLVDMLCYLRIHVELAISSKGLLMMREAGFKPPPPAGTREKFAELRHLERSIGPTGRRALAPLLHSSTRDLWQIYMLDQ